MADNDKRISAPLSAADGSAANAGGGPAGRELQVGAIVGGKYCIQSVIGRGGMGLVYLAEDQVFHRPYALKALAPERVNQTDWLRFQTEGKAIAKMDHPHIVKVFDMGADGSGCLYYVMELIEGVPLNDYILQKKLLPVDFAVELFSQLAAGLGYAHKLGLVHRDIKPSNIILTNEGLKSGKPIAKIIDFGLVKLLGEATQLKQSQTSTGQVCGSPLYMSPEQCMGGKIDQRSDIYSLGCTLFECLTGSPPFRGATGLETAFMHQNQAPPRMADLRPEKNYADNLEQLLSRMLEKNTTQRYQSMEQVSQDLDRVRKGKSINREAVYQTGTYYPALGAAADEGRVEEEYEAPQKFNPVIAACLAAALLAIGLGAYFTLQYFKAPSLPHINADTDINNQFPIAKPGKIENFEKVKAEYQNWPPISRGITADYGRPVRVFKFPHTPLGFVRYGNKRELAQGTITIPANLPVTLELITPEGGYARRFPGILSKIGPGDISVLEVTEPRGHLESTEETVEVTADFIRALSSWRSLTILDFYHALFAPGAVLALNQVQGVPELILHSADFDGVELGHLRWLTQVRKLDVKKQPRVDPILARLAGSRALEWLSIDGCEPSLQSLRGLSQCPNLKLINWSGVKLNRDQLSALCDIPNIEEMGICESDLRPEWAYMFKKCRHLKIISLGEVDPVVMARLKSVLPHCEIKGRPI